MTEQQIKAHMTLVDALRDADDEQAAGSVIAARRQAIEAHLRSLVVAPPVPEAVKQAADALAEIIAAGQLAKTMLDAGIPAGEPVHPVSARLTWPLSTATTAEEKLRALLATPAQQRPHPG